jgi:hypothetical protein
MNWVVERMRRTTHPSSCPPLGATTLMPSHSQGAERRTERRAGRTGSRWAVRTIVIGGLAGAAWLLTGAAAHAADRDPTTEGLLGSSLIGAAVDGESGSSVIKAGAVGKVLKAAAQPLESNRKADHQRVTSTVLSAPTRVLTRPAEVLTGTLDKVTAPNDTVDRVVRDLSGPLRLTGGPAVSGQLAPVATPLTRTLSPVTNSLPPAAQPAITQGAQPAQKPVSADAATRTADLADTHTAVAAGSAGHRDTVGAAGSAGKRHSTVTHRDRTAVKAGAPDMARTTTPGNDGPAPLQMHLGALSGTATSGSGAPTEGGSAAVLPAAVGGGTVADHRLPGATDVEARRHDAEAPTVSPD